MQQSFTVTIRYGAKGANVRQGQKANDYKCNNSSQTMDCSKR